MAELLFAVERPIVRQPIIKGISPNDLPETFVKEPRTRTPERPPSDSESNDFRQKKAGLIARLKRIEGQMRGIQEMIAQEDSCENIARQLAAARGALDRSFYEMVACSIERELGSLVNPKAHAALEEASRILAKYG